MRRAISLLLIAFLLVTALMAFNGLSVIEIVLAIVIALLEFDGK